MKARTKSIVVSVSGVILLYGLLGQTTQGQDLLNESGLAILADAFGNASGPEAIVVSWSVVENQSDIYSYSYVVINPPGDVVLNNNGLPTLTPEFVDAFSVAFNTLAPGAYIQGSQIGGTSVQNNGADGLFWSLGAIQPGTSSPTMSYESDLPPTLGDANAQDNNAPSPWSSYPNGQQVAVPTTIPEPASTSLFALGALVFVPFWFRIRRFNGKKAHANLS